jgi:hypothetical protein
VVILLSKTLYVTNAGRPVLLFSLTVRLQIGAVIQAIEPNPVIII